MGMARRKFRLGWFGLMLLASVMMFGCGGGGGDDGGGGGTPPPEVPTLLNYALGASSRTPLLSGTVVESGITYTVTTLNLAGTYNRDTKVTTLQENRVMAFTLSQRPPGLSGEGPINIGISTPAGSTATWISGQHPTVGRYVVTVEARDPITVQVNSGATGVELYVLGVLVSSMTWAQLEGVLDNLAATEDQILAGLAYNALQAVYRCASQAYTMIEVVMENQDTLVSSIHNEPGTSLPGYPAGMTAQWGDGNGNGEIDPGDNFLTRFSNWWVDAPAGNTDHFYNGRLLWLSYWEGVNSSGEYVGGDFQFGVTGDEFYDDEVDGVAPDTGTRISYSNSGMLFLLSW
jgi:hypothetical protein